MSSESKELELLPISKKSIEEDGWGKAYFDKWLEKYPEYEGHFEKTNWGRV